MFVRGWSILVGGCPISVARNAILANDRVERVRDQRLSNALATEIVVTHVPLVRIVVVLGSIAVAGCDLSSSLFEGPPRDRSDAVLAFDRATSIQICGRICRSNDGVRSGDRARISAAVAFAKRYQTDWRENVNAAGGDVKVLFWENDMSLGGFGWVATTDPDWTLFDGTLVRHGVPAHEIKQLMATLGMR